MTTPLFRDKIIITNIGGAFIVYIYNSSYIRHYPDCFGFLRCNRSIAVDIMPRREGDPASLVADNSKAKEILKWNPEKTLNDSIGNAYKWEQILQAQEIKC